MRAWIIARKPIISAATGRRFSDEELEILGGIIHCPIHVIGEVTENLKDDLIAEIRRLHPEFTNAEYELIVTERQYCHVL